jgi:hypothetical protein
MSASQKLNRAVDLGAMIADLSPASTASAASPADATTATPAAARTSARHFPFNN